MTAQASNAANKPTRASSPTQAGHTGAWSLWVLAAVLPALTTRNPAYLVLLLLAIAVVYAALPRQPSQAAGWGFFLRVALLIVLFTVLLNALAVHYGQTVLFTLPPSIPLIGGIVGGPVTLEAIAAGLLSGLALFAVLAVFATMNRAVDPYHLLRAVPPALFQTGVMASIALTFVPQAAVALREIREAQAIRGHRWRGLRDVVPLFLPLLTTGLERSLQLAESMEARGFGAAPMKRPAARRAGQSLLLVALLALLAGLLLRSLRGPNVFSAGLLAGGMAGSLVALFLHGHSVARTRYRPRRWSAGDTVVALCSGLTVLAYVAVQLFFSDLLSYSAYPRLAWPAFHPLVGAIFLALTAPAWSFSRRSG